ncbi:MAG: hypothetical protein AB8B72_04935 [Crocinitomicaceae bacterium]
MKNLLGLIVFLLSAALAHCQLGSKYNIGTAPGQANPAFTGTMENGAIHTNLYVAEYDYFILNSSYQTHLPKGNSGAGILLGTKRFESYSISKYGAAYSYQSNISEKLALSIGFAGYYTADRDDYFPEFDTSFFSLDGGLVLYSDRLFLSISAYEFKKRSESVRVKSMFGYQFYIKRLTGLTVTPVVGIAINQGLDYLNVRINAGYKKIKCVFGGATNEFLVGLGYENQKIGIHYLFSYFKSEFSSGFNLNNRFSLTIKLPRSIPRNTNCFDFQLF